MIAKALEIRDHHTFIPVIAVELVPDINALGGIPNEAQRYLLARCGLGMEGSYRVAVIKLATDEGHIDPHRWGHNVRTMLAAHIYINNNFDHLKDGDVVDARVICGETTEPAVSERFSAPL
jgi:hypothetical protein